MPTVATLAVGSKIPRRIRTSHFDDENEPCSSFGVQRHYKSSVHAQVHNHFNQERHLVAREVYKQGRSATPVGGAALTGSRHAMPFVDRVLLT
jgi:hypothetical protein